jgi:zinc protease
MGQAMEIGYLEAAGLSWRDEERLLEGLRSVTAAEVQGVAQRYFADDSLNVARLDPLPPGDARPRSPFANTRH